MKSKDNNTNECNDTNSLIYICKQHRCTVSKMGYGDLLIKNCLFSPPHYHSVPLFPMFPLEFRVEAKLTMRN